MVTSRRLLLPALLGSLALPACQNKEAEYPDAPSAPAAPIVFAADLPPSEVTAIEASLLRGDPVVVYFDRERGYFHTLPRCEVSGVYKTARTSSTDSFFARSQSSLNEQMPLSGARYQGKLASKGDVSLLWAEALRYEGSLSGDVSRSCPHREWASHSVVRAWFGGYFLSAGSQETFEMLRDEGNYVSCKKSLKLSHAPSARHQALCQDAVPEPPASPATSPVGSGEGHTLADLDESCRALVKIELAPLSSFSQRTPADRDKDGIIDALDACPTEAGVPESEGCPADRDKDGVVDALDACPDAKGVVSVEAKKNGCPVGDSDGDGILDDKDRCVAERGPAENNGCPWPDDDRDGIPNSKDRCPRERGPATLRGCPDRDGDRIPDLDDKCPDQSETFNGFQDEDGCPDQTIQPRPQQPRPPQPRPPQPQPTGPQGL